MVRITYAAEMNRLVKTTIDSGLELFDINNCMTSNGENILLNIVSLMILMKKSNIKDIESYRAESGWNKIYNTFLKLYKSSEKYNEQIFYFSKEWECDLFRILFMYTDNDGNDQYISLMLNELIDTKKRELISNGKEFGIDGASFRILLSEIFENIAILQGLVNVNFYFTHGSCRVRGTKITRTLSNVKEKDSILCFINKFNEEHRGSIIKIFSKMEQPDESLNFTIFNYYDILSNKGLYGKWNELGKDRIKQYGMLLFLDLQRIGITGDDLGNVDGIIDEIGENIGEFINLPFISNGDKLTLLDIFQSLPITDKKTSILEYLRSKGGKTKSEIDAESQLNFF